MIKLKNMYEDAFYEAADIGSIGITLEELLEYYRVLCFQ